MDLQGYSFISHFQSFMRKKEFLEVEQEHGEIFVFTDFRIVLRILIVSRIHFIESLCHLHELQAIRTDVHIDK